MSDAGHDPAGTGRQPLDPLDELDLIQSTGTQQRRHWTLWLFLLPFAAVIVPTVYDRFRPSLLGMSFFVWYQFAAVIFGAAVTGLIYVLRGTQRRLEK